MLNFAGIRTGGSGALAALALVVWAPMAGELLTTATPPAMFFIPWVFALYAGLYGLGALLIREASVKLNLSWPAILLLGAAYGVLEEGLCAKSFFDPHWRAIGPLGAHGRWLGVNWIWSAGLTAFHATYSIALSIAAVHVLMPKASRRPWLGRFSTALVVVLFAFVTAVFLSKGNEKYVITGSERMWCLVLICALVSTALLWPRRAEVSRPPSLAGWRSMFGCGFLSALSFIVILYFVPLAGGPAWLTAVLLVAQFVAAGLWLRSALDGGARNFSRSHLFGLLAGVYGFFILQAPLQELNPSRPDPAPGLSLVALGLGIGLAVVGRAVLREPESGERFGAAGLPGFF